MRFELTILIEGIAMTLLPGPSRARDVKRAILTLASQFLAAKCSTATETFDLGF